MTNPAAGADTYSGAELRALAEIGYEGPLTIEREIPQEPDRQKAEIRHASDLLTELKTKIG